MAWQLLAGAALGAFGDIVNKREQRKQAARALNEQKLSAKISYTAKEDAVNIMKYTSASNLENYIAELHRVGGAETREALDKIEVERSKSLAQMEGLTSGISKARAQRSFEVGANKILADMKGKTVSQISKAIDEKDKVQNDLNNQLLQAHSELQGVLSQTLPKTNFLSDLLGTVNAGLAGATAGSQAFNMFGTPTT